MHKCWNGGGHVEKCHELAISTYAVVRYAQIEQIVKFSRAKSFWPRTTITAALTGGRRASCGHPKHQAENRDQIARIVIEHDLHVARTRLEHGLHSPQEQREIRVTPALAMAG